MGRPIRSKQRSAHGCRNCRSRRVKCDETRPTCQRCARLGYICDSSVRWKFVYSNQSTKRGYQEITESPEKVLQPSLFGSETVPDLDSTTSDEDPSHRQGTARSDVWDVRGPNGTCLLAYTSFVNLTPMQFVKNVPGGLLRFSDTAADAILDNKLERLRKEILLQQYHPQACPPLSVTLDGTEFIRRSLALRWTFGQIVCRKIMPLAYHSPLHLEEEKNIILHLSETFAPLHHAVCAISILAIRSHDCPISMELAFQHYGKATTMAESCGPSLHRESIFFLHFLLLLFDVACASRRWLEGQNAWFRHLNMLADLAHVFDGTLTSSLKAYLSWYVLTLDSYAVLTGAEGAGHYVNSFLDGRLCLPPCPGKENYNQDSLKAPIIAYQYDNLYALMCTSLAEQSQLSLRLRAMHLANSSQGELTRGQSESLVLREACQWRIDYPWLEGTSDSISEPQDYDCNSLMDIWYSRIQYWVFLSHIHIRFCSRTVTGDGQLEDLDDKYYSNLSSLVRRSIKAGNEQDHLHVYALFLAGVLAGSLDARTEVSLLLSQMRGAGLSGSVDRVISFLDTIFRAIPARQDSSQAGTMVMWSDIEHEIDLAFVVIGL